ncbi:helix-turn-helix domain-containing protein [Vannielia litorea]|uniref:helix-turn-helix domain-containing protein n=1 Tax=Vannielia TaxID=2813041 RepID=UPI001C98D946|nr:helix-turn-helix transcriptional regulator [Vannielia litorea]MBY6048063.1 helix-turn-helix domain-containing protein [Vannielia litorea]MBY6075477.1 helix-turn-helix domain-containing protein [Vannielia litorea]MBY6152037.1 helix-turn-helix domain-containing protein [Vannielia litorea]
MESESGSWFDAETATFGDRVAGAREALGWSQKQLAERLGVKTKTVKHWEADASEPRANKLQMLAGMLGVSMRWLLSGEGPGIDAPLPEGVVPAAAPAELAGLLAEIRAVRGEMVLQAERLERLETRLQSALEATE